MKQKEIIIDSCIDLQAEEMIKNYFLIKTVSDIQGFVYSEKEFLKKYKNTYAFNNFRLANYYAVYTIDGCENCHSPFEVLITNRQDIYNEIEAKHKTCNGCKIHASATESLLGFKL